MYLRRVIETYIGFAKNGIKRSLFRNNNSEEIGLIIQGELLGFRLYS